MRKIAVVGGFAVGAALTLAPLASATTVDPTFVTDVLGSEEASDPGAYDVFNGALTEFDNALNVELYALADGGTLDTNVGDYIFNSSLEHALTLANTTDAAEYLFNFGLGDLAGYFDTSALTSLF